MTTAVSKLVPISIMPGVCPPTDATPSKTPHYTAAKGIRFVKDRPQKVGGWTKITMNGTALSGAVRSIYSAVIADKVYTMLGSNEKLYALVGSTLTNMTPLDATTPITAADSLSTHYTTLAANPIHTTIDSNQITIDDAEAARYVPGDRVTIAGATGTGGILAAAINKEQIIRAVGANAITIKVATNATSTASGGGAAVTRTSGLVTLTKSAHGLANGDRVGVSGVVDFGGILAAQANVEHIIRGVTTNTFDFTTNGVATSAVTAAGGTATEYLNEIPDGLLNVTSGQGYGMGKYGVGLYGTALVSGNSRRFPRIWFFDSFGDTILATAGSQTGVYRWGGDSMVAPVLVPNAPDAVNYSFVSDNTLVTFGAGDVPNKIFASDQNDIEMWVSSSSNQVYEDNIEGAGKLISHVNVDGTNLIFTQNQCYTFKHIGLPLVWDIDFKDNIGIIGPMARVVVKGVAYWMSSNNFYKWEGGNIEILASNSSKETTLLNYIFQNINKAQQYKSFAWYNQQFDEIWFHYPSAASNEVDSLARFHVTDLHWTPDTLDRTAAEYPNLNLQYPRLIDSSNSFFRHETGVDDDVNPLAFNLVSNTRDFGTPNILQSGIIPDSIQTGNLDFQVDAFSYPQSPIPKNSKAVTVTPTTEQLALDIDGRFLRYTFAGEELGQQWIMGAWLEPMQVSARSE